MLSERERKRKRTSGPGVGWSLHASEGELLKGICHVQEKGCLRSSDIGEHLASTALGLFKEVLFADQQEIAPESDQVPVSAMRAGVTKAALSFRAPARIRVYRRAVKWTTMSRVETPATTVGSPRATTTNRLATDAVSRRCVEDRQKL